jgi:hypothetical protein
MKRNSTYVVKWVTIVVEEAVVAAGRKVTMAIDSSCGLPLSGFDGRKTGNSHW